MSNKMKIYSVVFAGMMALAGLSPVSYAADAKTGDKSKASQAAKAAEKEKVVIQVTDGSPKNWYLALANAKNVQDLIGKENVEVEIVAYGPGISMLKLESEAIQGIEKAMDNGVKVVACQNTMQAQKLQESDMMPKISYVKAGVVELMRKQKEGYAYIRP